MCPPFLVRIKRVPRPSYPRSHCYNTRQCIAALVATPSVVPLLLLGEGIIGKLRKETGQSETDRPLLLLATPIRLRAPVPLICFFDGTVALRDVRACFKENSSLHISIPKAGLSLLNDLFYQKILFIQQDFRMTYLSLHKQPFISAHFDSSLHILCITAR